MKSNIEFRGKIIDTTDNGKWAYGDLSQQNGNCYIKENHIYKTINPQTIGQYSGLKDLNGVKVFSGDIVQFNDNCGTWISVVIFTRGLFGLDVCKVKQIKNPEDWDKPYDKVKSRWWSAHWGYEEIGTAFEYRTPLAKRTLYAEGKPGDHETYNKSDYYAWHEKHGWGEYRLDAEIVGCIHDTPELLEKK